MAEMILHIGDRNGYDDGDVINAYNDKQIWHMALMYLHRVSNHAFKARIKAATFGIAVDDVDYDDIWTQLENLTIHRRENYTRVMHGDVVRKRFLAVGMTNCDFARCHELSEEPVEDDDRIVDGIKERPVKGRIYKVDYRRLFRQRDLANIDDLQQITDYRDQTIVDHATLTPKPGARRSRLKKSKRS